MQNSKQKKLSQSLLQFNQELEMSTYIGESLKINESSSSTSGDKSISDDNVKQITYSLNVETQDNDEKIFVEKYKYVFLGFASMLLFGGYYNYMFQSFIKQQFLDSMNLDNNQYSLFISLPPIPNIVFPLLVGPILDVIGIRNGLLFFSFLMVLGMFFVFISSFTLSFPLILTGKIIHQIGMDNLHLTQCIIVSKWFYNSSVSTALTLCSLVMKVALSISGVLYPALYNTKNNLKFPFLLGFLSCVVSFICAFVVVFIDNKRENIVKIMNNGQTVSEQQNNKKKFNIKDIKQLGVLFWAYLIQTFLLWGALYAVQSYAQPLMINKFKFQDSEASFAISIVAFVAISTPFFGYLSDRFAKRGQFLLVTILLGSISIFILLILPSEYNSSIKGGVYASITLLGVFLTLIGAYLWPVIPILIPKQYLGTAFGICYATKNIASSLFSIIGGQLMGEDDQGYQSFSLIVLIIFLCSFIIGIISFVYDRNSNNILDTVQIKKNESETKV